MSASFVTTGSICVAVVFPVLATLALFLRFYARSLTSNGRLRLDDWMILLTVMINWGHSINTIVAGAEGGINQAKLDPIEYANVALRTLWISGLLIVTSLTTVKVSILLFYHHIFYINQRFRTSLYVMMATLVAWWIASFLCSMLATKPISGNWDVRHASERFSVHTLFTTYAGLSILFDIVVLCFPIPMIRTLRVSTQQKVSIIGIFWLGGFCCVAALARFVVLYREAAKLEDLRGTQYSSQVQAFIWSEIEPNSSVIAACLPTYGPFFANGAASTVTRTVRSIATRFGITRLTSSETAKLPTLSDTLNSNTGAYHELDEHIAPNDHQHTSAPKETSTIHTSHLEREGDFAMTSRASDVER